MNWIDLVFLGLGLFSLVLGFQKGLLKQTAVVGSIALGILLAGRLHGPLAESRFFEVVSQQFSMQASRIAAYIGIFVGTLALVCTAAFLLRHSIKDGAMGHIDSLLGGLLGLVKAYVVCALLSLAVFQFMPGRDIGRHFSQSYAAPRIVDSFRTVMASLPDACTRTVNALIAREQPVQAGPDRGTFCFSHEDPPIWQRKHEG